MDVFFFNQSGFGKRGKRLRKDIEELPQSLRFAHLNPKVAAYLANKERKSSLSEGPNVDKDDRSALLEGIDVNKQNTILPEINEALTEIKHELDKTNKPDEDAAAYLFKECKSQSLNILVQIAALLQYLHGYKIRVPKTLEYHLLSSYKDLIANAVYVHRDWQTKVARDAFEKEKLRQQRKEEEKEKEREKAESEKESEKDHDNSSVFSYDVDKKEKPDKGHAAVKKNSKKLTKQNLADILEVETEGDTGPLSPGYQSSSKDVPTLNISSKERSPSLISSKPIQSSRTPKSTARSDHPNWKSQFGDWLAVPGRHGPPSRAGSVRKGSRERGLSVSSRDDLSTIGDNHSESSRISNAGHGGYYMSIISFALSSKACEEKGWIVHSDKPDEKETVLEWAQHRLQIALRGINEQAEKNREQGLNHPLDTRFYGDAKKDAIAKYQRRNVTLQKDPEPVLAEGIYPIIPSFMVEEEADPDKVVCAITTTDGTKSVYYPSGRLAVMVSPAGLEKPGVYINAYSDEPDMQLLASFTPSGQGSCFYKNSVVRFLATEKGGHIANADGAITKKWKWPSNPNSKLPLTIVINMSDELSFRCLNQSSMQLTFCCQKESFTWCVAPTVGATESNDIGHLMSGLHFTSLTAKEVQRSHKLKAQQKPKVSRAYSNKQKEKIKNQLLELKSQVDATDQFETESDRELARLQQKLSFEIIELEWEAIVKKSRNVMDEWLEYYRIAVGVKSPLIKSMTEEPPVRQRRISKSARGAPKGPSLVLAGPGESTRDGAVSTPPVSERTFDLERPSSAVNLITPRDEIGDTQPSITVENTFDIAVKVPDIVEVPPTRSGTPGTIAVQISTTGSAKSRTTVTSAVRLQRSSAYACPIALRKDILGEGDATCRCHRYKIPYIMDVEFDDFINKYVAEKQLIIICIVSSLYPQSNSTVPMLEILYSEQNKNRTHPCLQSLGDPFRILLYDVASAAEFSNCTKPLLLRRHNVAAGMFLMYQGGQLVFCDHIWNGYGNARKDFYKQMMKSRHDARKGLCLPKDFRFSPSKGHRGKRAAWGGEIGGAGVDKFGSPGVSIESSVMDIPDRPDTASSTSSDSRDMLRPSFQIRSLTSDGFYPPLTPLPPATPKIRATTAPLRNNNMDVLRKSTSVR